VLPVCWPTWRSRVAYTVKPGCDTALPAGIPDTTPDPRSHSHALITLHKFAAWADAHNSQGLLTRSGSKGWSVPGFRSQIPGPTFTSTSTSSDSRLLCCGLFLVFLAISLRFRLNISSNCECDCATTRCDSDCDDDDDDDDDDDSSNSHFG